jgi:hypothetical protein
MEPVPSSVALPVRVAESWSVVPIATVDALGVVTIDGVASGT